MSPNTAAGRRYFSRVFRPAEDNEYIRRYIVAFGPPFFISANDSSVSLFPSPSVRRTKRRNLNAIIGHSTIRPERERRPRSDVPKRND